jgi:membrane protein DedA with SNARE-associated domain
LQHLLVSGGYFALFFITLLSAMGIPVGSELAMVYGGALASGHILNTSHHFNLVVLILVATAGDVGGSSLGYAVGRIGGRPLVEAVGRYVLLTNKDLDRAEAWFDRRGEPAVFFGRFIPFIRSFISVAAGLAEMALPIFLVFTTLACAIWCAGLTIMGYELGASYAKASKDFNDVGYLAAAVAVVVVAVFLYHRIKTVRAEGGVRRQQSDG